MASIQSRLQRINDLGASLSRPVKMMEVCGTHTMAAFQSGLRSLLPAQVQLISGPGCPVCVTAIDYIDQAVSIAKEPNVIIASFGDMLRVPGSDASLEQARALGADIQVVYSPTDALLLAKNNPEKIVVFLGVGFETTAPAIAWTIRQAHQKGIQNYKVLCAHKTMPQAMDALLKDRSIGINAFICPGHVSVIIGTKPYEFIPANYNIPCVVVGFEPFDLVIGIEMLLDQLIARQAKVDIEYTRCVNSTGNPAAQKLLADVFEPDDARWRGLGIIPGSGLKIRQTYASIDAAKHFAHLPVPTSQEPKGCRCGDVLRGVITPLQCPLFKTTCTPDQPVGACMVSSEGTCAAYYKYSRN